MAGGEGAEDAAGLLRELEERLERASAAAERLAAQAAGAAAERLAASAGVPRPDAGGVPRPPAAGWQPASGEGRRPLDEDLDALLRLVRGLGEAIPPELRRSLADALRELLHALRALVDWCLERIEQRSRDEPEVEEIPIL